MQILKTKKVNKLNSCFSERHLQELTLMGHEYLSYDLTNYGEGIVGQNDLVKLDFLSNQPSGLIFFTGRL